MPMAILSAGGLGFGVTKPSISPAPKSSSTSPPAAPGPRAAHDPGEEEPGPGRRGQDDAADRGNAVRQDVEEEVGATVELEHHGPGETDVDRVREQSGHDIDARDAQQHELDG